MTLECVGELHSPEGQTELELWEQHHISPQILSQSLLTELFNYIFFCEDASWNSRFVCAVFLKCNWKKVDLLLCAENECWIRLLIVGLSLSS